MRSSLGLARGAAASGAAIVLGIVAMPAVLFWIVHQRRARARSGYAVLWPFMVRTLEGYAFHVVRGQAPAGGWTTVARNVDRYVALTRKTGSPRIWRIQGLAVLMEIAPVLDGRLPFSRLSEGDQAHFIATRLEGQRGVFGLVGLGRQLVRFGYYAAPSTGEAMGYRPMERRGRMRRRKPVVLDARMDPGQTLGSLELVS